MSKGTAKGLELTYSMVMKVELMVGFKCENICSCLGGWSMKGRLLG